MLQVLRNFKHFNNLNPMTGCFEKLKKSLCLQFNRVTQKKEKNLRRYNRLEDAVCAPWERCVRAVNTLQQLLARCKNVMDAEKTPWERRVDAVGTLWGRCVHAITGKFDI